MTSIADVNVVFAILVANHEHHRRAWRWWSARDDSSVGWCAPVKLGVLRLLTNKLAMRETPLLPVEALDAWDAFASDPRVVEVAAPASAHSASLRRLVEGRQATPNLWTDAWLAALAESAGAGLTSFDAGMKSHGIRDFELLRG